MEYYITKQDHKNEWRVYFDDKIDTDGQILYQGHKLGLESKDMIKFLEYRQERSSGKFFFLNYQNLKDVPDTTDSTMWFVGSGATIEKIINESWSSLEKKIVDGGKKIRKITITKAYI